MPVHGFSVERRELRDLWISISVACSLALYHILVSLVGFRLFEGQYAGLMFQGMFLWTMGLLWIAYRRWRHVSVQQLKLKDLLSSISMEVIMVVDQRRRIAMVNGSVRSLFGYEEAEVLNQPTEILYGDRRTNKATPHEVRDTLDEVGFHVGEATGHKKQGEAFPLEIVTAPLRGNEGVVILVRDITERKRAQKAILQAKERAEAADDAKGKVLAELQQSYQKLQELEELRDNLTHMIVHDMRTPLQVVVSNLEMLVHNLKQKPDEENREIATETAQYAQRLADMANSVLDVSRLEASKLPLNKTKWNLFELAGESLKSVETLLNDIKTSCEDPGQPVSVEGDRDLIRRVITNLLSNAIKYSPPGSQIVVVVTRNQTHARLSVKDSGPGISPEYQEKIFEKFGQADTKQYRRTHGAGIGLTFCKLAVEAHGGTIGVESEVGKGSTFWIQLPSA